MNSALSILLVDDHSFLRRGMRSFFERALPGATIHEAENAESAYASMRQDKISLVMMDLQLPGDDGITAANRICREHPQTRVIIVSGQSGGADFRRDVNQALSSGIQGFISKADGEEFALLAIHAVLKGQVFLSPTPCTELAAALRLQTEVVDEKNRLTPKELTVLKRVAEGASYKELATEMGLSVKTVDTYRTRLTRKLKLNSREELQATARRFGLTA